jgi:hypothetical protein
MHCMPSLEELVQYLYLTFPEAASPGAANAIMPAVVAIKVAANINLRIRVSYHQAGHDSVRSRARVGQRNNQHTGYQSRVALSYCELDR